MIRPAAFCLIVCALAACGGKSDPAAITETAPKALGQMPIERDAPAIGVMALPNVDSFCTFFAEGHVFDYNDEATWQFVMITQFPEGDIGPENGDALMQLNTVQRRLELITQTDTETGERREYRTVDAPVFTIEVDMVAGEAGYESTPYTGTLTPIFPKRGEPVRFYGDCGV